MAESVRPPSLCDGDLLPDTVSLGSNPELDSGKVTKFVLYTKNVISNITYFIVDMSFLLRVSHINYQLKG